MNAVGHREVQGAINLVSFRTDAAATATEKRMNLGGSLEVTMKPESSQRQMVIETRPVRELNTLKGEMGETTDGDQTDGRVERERRGDSGHLYGPECCSVCGQDPFECGCLNLSFESRWEKQRREEREREREMVKMAGSDQVDPLKVLRGEMAEMSLRVEKLERVVLWEGSGCSSRSSGNEWAWWNGAWWIRTKSMMNSASKRKVSRAVKQRLTKMMRNCQMKRARSIFTSLARSITSGSGIDGSSTPHHQMASRGSEDQVASNSDASPEMLRAICSAYHSVSAAAK